MKRVRRLEHDEERREALALHHAAFASRRPLAVHQAERLASGLRARAERWVLEEHDVFVSFLLRWELVFAEGDRAWVGSAIGSVCTRPGLERRGHASTLIRAADRGHVGLLFSAVPPAIYERLGYRVVPAWDHMCVDAAGLALSGSRVPLVPIDPARSLDRLTAAWNAGHPGLRLHRDPARWARSLAENEADLFFAAGDEGYVRLHLGDRLEIVELFGTDPAPAIRACAALADELGVPLHGWFDPVPEIASWFTDRGRQRTLPMVRGAGGTDSARFWSSDYCSTRAASRFSASGSGGRRASSAPRIAPSIVSRVHRTSPAGVPPIGRCAVRPSLEIRSTGVPSQRTRSSSRASWSGSWRPSTSIASCRIRTGVRV